MKISCLCVTRGLFVANAVEQFEKQLYPNRELVCVYQDNLSTMDVARLRRVNAVLIKGKTSHTLGHLRQLALEAARGEFVCQWDDDDLYSPERLATMLGALRDQSADAAVLRRWYIDDVHARVMYLSSERNWEGSALVRTSLARDIGYTSLCRGEDSAFWRTLEARDVPVAHVHEPRLYVYRVHGGNTWDRSHFDALIGHAELVSANKREAVLWSVM